MRSIIQNDLEGGQPPTHLYRLYLAASTLSFGSGLLGMEQGSSFGGDGSPLSQCLPSVDLDRLLRELPQQL